MGASVFRLIKDFLPLPSPPVCIPSGQDAGPEAGMTPGEISPTFYDFINLIEIKERDHYAFG
jgi:hypothetical protein